MSESPVESFSPVESVTTLAEPLVTVAPASAILPTLEGAGIAGGGQAERGEYEGRWLRMRLPLQ
jgi:hypothetical protein